MNTLDDRSNASFWEQVTTLSRSYWIANWMEMFERLAYYGLRTVLPIYMLLAIEEGGPQFDNLQKGTIYMWWAAYQSFIPVFSGGFADRYGYKRTVAISIAVKCAGYLVMAYAVDLAAAATGGASLTEPGDPVTYGFFMVGALLLATGTAVFKPGLQGIIATQVDDRNSSTAWAIFYQLVNLGGFLGPFLAGAMRLMAWKWVFISCAVIVCVNYPLLLTFAEPDKSHVPKQEGDDDGPFTTVVRSVAGILEPRLLGFLAVFSGFWAMFYQLFDLLPNFIDDWVDSSGLYAAAAVPLFGLFGNTPPAEWAGNVPQEMMINLNAMLITFFAFAVGYVTGFLRSMQAMIVGILVSAVGIVLLGNDDGWIVLGAIAIFSVGEMMASPTKMRYFASIAPEGKKGLYLGYINATVGIGWSLGSLVAGAMYEEGGDKVVLARRHLVETLGQDAAAVEALPKTEVMPALADALGTDVAAAQALLFETYDPGTIFYWFAVIGLVSMLGLVVFDQLTRRAPSWESWGLVVLTGLVTGICYSWFVGLLFAAAMAARELIGTGVWQVAEGTSQALDRSPQAVRGLVLVVVGLAAFIIPAIWI